MGSIGGLHGLESFYWAVHLDKIESPLSAQHVLFLFPSSFLMIFFFFWVERMNGLSKKKKKQMIFTAHRVKQLENLSPNTNILCFE